MTDRLALADVIEDGGIERAKAVKIATAIFDAIHDNVATKADVQAMRTDMQAAEARLDAKITAVSARIDLVEHRLLTRLGGLVVVLSGAIVAALHYWPPHG